MYQNPFVSDLSGHERPIVRVEGLRQKALQAIPPLKINIANFFRNTQKLWHPHSFPTKEAGHLQLWFLLHELKN